MYIFVTAIRAVISHNKSPVVLLKKTRSMITNKIMFDIIIHQTDSIKIAEVQSDAVIINSAEDGISLLGTVYFDGFDCVILQEKQITPIFFDLKTGLAGEILQKFSTYRIRLAIVGNFSKFSSQSLRDFIYESNKGKMVCFVESVEDAINKLRD